MAVPIYVVSESTNNARLTRFNAQFGALVDDFIVMPGVMGGQLSARDYYRHLHENYNHTQRILSPAEVGCALSHLAIYQKVVSHQAPAVVFEDDVIGSKAALAKARELATKVQPHQVVILGGLNGLPEKKWIKTLEKGPSASNSLHLYLDSSAAKISALSYPYLGRTCSYIIGHEAANIIIEKQNNCLHVADAWGYFSEQSALEFYYINLFDHPVESKVSNSYIEQERSLLNYVASYKLALRKLLYLSRKKIKQLKLLTR